MKCADCGKSVAELVEKPMPPVSKDGVTEAVKIHVCQDCYNKARKKP